MRISHLEDALGTLEERKLTDVIKLPVYINSHSQYRDDDDEEELCSLRTLFTVSLPGIPVDALLLGT